MIPLCPCCGYNLEAEKPLVTGRFGYSPVGGFTIDGERMGIPPRLHNLLGTIMAGKGSLIRNEAITNRHSEDTANPSASLSVAVCQLRAAFRLSGIDPPFERIWGVGMRWTGPEVVL